MTFSAPKQGLPLRTNAPGTGAFVRYRVRRARRVFRDGCERFESWFAG